MKNEDRRILSYLSRNTLVDTIRSSGLHSFLRSLIKWNRERTDQDPSYFYSTLWMKNEDRRILSYLSRNTLPDTKSSSPDTEIPLWNLFPRHQEFFPAGFISVIWWAWAKFSRQDFLDPAKIPDFYPPGPSLTRNFTRNGDRYSDQRVEVTTCNRSTTVPEQ